MDTVSIILDGEEVELRPSAHAATAISRRVGGLLPAMDRLAVFDEDFIVGAVALGLNADPDEIAEKVKRTGTWTLAEPVTEFVYLLIGGGYPVERRPGQPHWAAPSAVNRL